MDGDLYDEFGNYIGPDLESDSDDEQSVYADNRDADEDAMEEDEDGDAEPEVAPMSVVLHEDKRYVNIFSLRTRKDTWLPYDIWLFTNWGGY